MKDIFLNRRIRQFIIIYEAENIHKAAGLLNISQPALSSSLHHLEMQVQTKLFSRSVQGMKPTEAGHILYRFAKNVMRTEQLSIDEIRATSEPLQGCLRIGSGVAWTTIFPMIVHELNAEFPDITLELTTGVGDDLAHRLEQGDLDIVLAAGAPLTNPHLYERIFLRNFTIYAVADASSLLAKKAEVTPNDLATAKWIGFSEDEGMSQYAHLYFKQFGLNIAKTVMRTDSSYELLSFLKGTEYVSILVEPLAELAVKQGFITLPTTMPLWSLPLNIYQNVLFKQHLPIRRATELIKQCF